MSPWAGWLHSFRSDSNSNLLIHPARSRAGLTPLELAAERGKAAASEWLVRRGPSFLKAQYRRPDLPDSGGGARAATTKPTPRCLRPVPFCAAARAGLRSPPWARADPGSDQAWIPSRISIGSRPDLDLRPEIHVNP